jgi:hypothetical protein
MRQWDRQHSSRRVAGNISQGVAVRAPDRGEAVAVPHQSRPFPRQPRGWHQLCQVHRGLAQGGVELRPCSRICTASSTIEQPCALAPWRNSATRPASRLCSVRFSMGKSIVQSGRAINKKGQGRWLFSRHGDRATCAGVGVRRKGEKICFRVRKKLCI